MKMNLKDNPPRPAATPPAEGNLTEKSASLKNAGIYSLVPERFI